MSDDESERGDPEPDFQDDLAETQEAIENALNELTKVKAYALTADEIADFKAAQYALRNLCDEYDKTHEVSELYEVDICVTGDEEEYKK